MKRLLRKFRKPSQRKGHAKQGDADHKQKQDLKKIRGCEETDKHECECSSSKSSSGGSCNINAMTTPSPSGRNRRLLGSRVLQQTKDSNSPITSQFQNHHAKNQDHHQHLNRAVHLNENNCNCEKENKGTRDSNSSFVASHLNSQPATMDSCEESTMSGSSFGSRKKNAKGNHKVTMSWSDLQERINQNSGTVTSATKTPMGKASSFKSMSTTPTHASNNSVSDHEISPKSSSSWERTGSDMMYSSIADNFMKQVPSARTISDQLFPVISSASSSSTSSVGLALSKNSIDYDRGDAGMFTDSQQKLQGTNKAKFRGGRARMLHEREREQRRKSRNGAALEARSDDATGMPRGHGENMKDAASEFKNFSSRENLSPETLKIIDEVDDVYEKSPISLSYAKLSSPMKTPVSRISVSMNGSTAKEKDEVRTGGRRKSAVVKNVVEASEWLTQQGFEINRTQRKEKKKVARGARSASPKPSPKCSGKSDDGKVKRTLSAGNTSIANTSDHSFERESLSAPNKTLGNGQSMNWKSFPDSTKNQGRRSPLAISSGPNKPSKKPAALAVQREKQQRQRRLSDSKCPSNNVDGRRNLDKRTARLRYAESFRADILSHRQCFPYLNCGSNHFDKVGSEIQDRGMNGVSVMVRKRPIFDYELDRGDYDIVSIDNSTEDAHDVCVVHNCVMHPDMKQMLMKPTSYFATAAFDEHCSDDDIYRHVAEPLVKDVAAQGVATILMYGQTGCGKSHTMSGIESRTAHGLFQTLDSLVGDGPQRTRPTVTVQFVEICGSKECKDLLDKATGDVKLADDEDGSCRLLNAACFDVKSPDELLSQIMLAKGRRATEATDKNGVSSRSHAVCQIQIINGNKRGVLSLIDLAGSERRHDSMYHSSERQKESAEINASLYALKECIRARANKHSRIPYRNSSLTRILRESFEREGARLCVIACVAPNATDTEHTMETLKLVSSIVGADDKIKEEKAHAVALPMQKKNHVPPKDWDNKQLRKFLSVKKMNKVKLLDEHDGKALMKMGLPQMRAQLFEDRDNDMADRLFSLLRKENERVNKILRAERNNIANERKGRL